MRLLVLGISTESKRTPRQNERHDPKLWTNAHEKISSVMNLLKRLVLKIKLSMKNLILSVKNTLT